MICITTWEFFSGLILSVPSPLIKGQVYHILTTMNEELSADSALIVQSGALLVSHNGFIKFFANV